MSSQEVILQHLVLLMMSKSPIVSLLSAQVIRSACHHYSDNEQKLEKMNKSVLIRGSKPDETRPERLGRTHLHATLFQMSSHVDRNPARRGFFFQAILEYIKYTFKVFNEQDHILSLRLTGLGLILNSFFQERLSSTSIEDIAVFAEMVHKSDWVTDERASNKPVFHIFDEFSLMDTQYFDVQYVATLVISQSLDFFFKQEDWKNLAELQGYILTYSIQFIWHLYLQVTSKSTH